MSARSGRAEAAAQHDNQPQSKEAPKGCLHTHPPDKPEKQLKSKLPKQWKFDPMVPLQHVPEFDETADPWDNCRKPVEAYDKERCWAWNEDISNLITFTGLFSAVVTAFLIDSYKWLIPDPDDVTHQWLERIALGSNTPPGDNPSSETFRPTARQVRINVYYFLSLSLSLTVALMGITCKQWINEYQRDAVLSPKNALRLRQWRYHGLEKWQMPDIIASLPIILQLAVFLFFIGIFEFLLSRNDIVAIFVGVNFIFISTFSVVTSLLPTFSLWDISRNINYPCPFKSPQAWFWFLMLQPLFNFLWGKPKADMPEEVGDQPSNSSSLPTSMHVGNHKSIMTRAGHNVRCRFKSLSRKFRNLSRRKTGAENLFGKDWSFVESNYICGHHRGLLKESLLWVVDHLHNHPKVKRNLLLALSTWPSQEVREFLINEKVINALISDETESTSDRKDLGVLDLYRVVFAGQFLSAGSSLVEGELLFRKLDELLEAYKGSNLKSLDMRMHAMEFARTVKQTYLLEWEKNTDLSFQLILFLEALFDPEMIRQVHLSMKDLETLFVDMCWDIFHCLDGLLSSKDPDVVIATKRGLLPLLKTLYYLDEHIRDFVLDDVSSLISKDADAALEDISTGHVEILIAINDIIHDDPTVMTEKESSRPYQTWRRRQIQILGRAEDISPKLRIRLQKGLNREELNEAREVRQRVIEEYSEI